MHMESHEILMDPYGMRVEYYVLLMGNYEMFMASYHP